MKTLLRTARSMEMALYPNINKSGSILGLVIVVGLIGTCVAEELGEDAWALLVASTGIAGSWVVNYAIQSSVCHGYHVVLATGIPAERIIVMLPDDAANNPLNTKPGKLFNSFNGPDVYAGVKIDYRGEDVTPENFLNILSGNKSAMAGKGTGRVIESGEKTNLFVYLSDHGGTQVVEFGDAILTAIQLRQTIAAMRSQKKYNKMFFFLECCFAGSMFDNLYPADWNVFAMTAASSKQYLFACNCGTDINGACLSIEFSSGWTGLLDSQLKGTHLSFDDIFQYTFQYVENSNVRRYGNLALGSDEIIANEVGVTPTPVTHCTEPSRVSMTEAHLHQLKWQVSHAKDAESLKKAESDLLKYIREEQQIVELKSELLELIASEHPDIKSLHLNGETLPTNLESSHCYHDILTHFKEHCVHPMRFTGGLTIFANACVVMEETEMQTLKREMISICEPYKALRS